MTSIYTMQGPKTRQERVRPIGGLFEDIFESVHGSFTGTERQKPNASEQSMTGFQTPRGREHIIWQANVLQEIATAQTTTATKDSLQQRRTEVNAIIGIGNTSYTGTVNEQGEVSLHVRKEYELKNSEMTLQEMKAAREGQVAQATGEKTPSFGQKENDLLMGGERTGTHVMNTAG